MVQNSEIQSDNNFRAKARIDDFLGTIHLPAKSVKDDKW